MAKNKQKRRGSTLDFVSAFILTIEDNLTSDLNGLGLSEPGRRIMFSDNELGGLLLTSEEAREYDEVLEGLILVSPHRDVVSKRTVEKWLQTAMLRSIRPTDSPPDTFEERLSAELDQLFQRLHESPATYDVMLPTQGISELGLPLEFGNVSFFVFTEEACQELRDIVEEGAASEAAKVRKMSVIDEMKSDVEQKVFARVRVVAVDESSARSIATREVRMVLDAVNFLGLFVPYNNGQATLPGDASSAEIVLPVIRRGETPSIGISYSTVQPYSTLQLEKVVYWEDEQLIQAVGNLLRGTTNKLQGVLLSAIQWAGRSVTEKRREEAFLLLVVALEALLLCDNEPIELGYRLRIRLAHLLGGTYGQRSRIVKEMSKLYTLRSQIVHSGKSEVTDSDLIRIQGFTISSIYRVLVDAPFRTMQMPNDLRDWFDSRILGEEIESLQSSESNE